MDAERLRSLPGSEIVIAGLEDLARGTESSAAAAVLMAGTRLRAAGVAVPQDHDDGTPPAHRLYEALAREHGTGAHSRYNAVLRRVSSFARALEHAQSG